jgi:hypothetical protein
MLMEAGMQELRSEEIGGRKVALIEQGDNTFAVTIAVRGPAGAWEDISFLADAGLIFAAARRRYHQRVTEQHQTLAYGVL